MQTDTTTTTLAPTDAEIEDLLKSCGICWAERSFWQLEDADLHPAIRAVLAKWGAPAPANFPARITALLHEVKRGPWEDASGEPLQDDAAAALAWIAAPPAQEARVPLSDEQIFKAYTTATGKKLLKQGPARPGLLQIFRLAEAAHGITAAQKGTP